MRITILALLIMPTAVAVGQSHTVLAERDAFLAAPATALPFVSFERSFYVAAGASFDGVVTRTRAFATLVSSRRIARGIPYKWHLSALTPPCIGCDSWVLGSLEFQVSPIGVPLQGSLGMGRSLSRESSSSSSIALFMPFGISKGRFDLVMNAGGVFAGTSSNNARSRGIRPAGGANASVRLGKAALSVFAHGVVLPYTYPMFGAQLGWMP